MSGPTDSQKVVLLRIIVEKFGGWNYVSYRDSVHPEYVAIRNIISKNPQHSFILISYRVRAVEHFKWNNVHFYNLRHDTRLSYFFSSFLRFELGLLLKPSVTVSMGTTNMIPLAMSGILTGAKHIPILTGEIWYSIKTTPRLLRKAFAFLLKITFRKAHTILTLSQSIKKELILDYGVDPEKILVYKYKMPEMFNPAVPKNLKLVLNSKGPIVLTVCRTGPEKGLEYLVEASRIIAEKVPNVKVIIKGGSGAHYNGQARTCYEVRLRKLINEYDLHRNVEILEYSPHSEIPKYMSAADVFVLPSLSEGLGMVILEALATGIPVVASRVGGIPDVLIDEYNGLLVEPRDTEGLAEAIVRILSDDKLRKRLIEGGLASTQPTKENEFETLLSKSIF